MRDCYISVPIIQSQHIKSTMYSNYICDFYLELSHDKIYRYRYFLHQKHKTHPSYNEKNNHKIDLNCSVEIIT